MRALKSLYNQKLSGNVSISHYLTDDNSSDGTGDLVKLSFPDVKIFLGTGSLFWAGGMRFGFESINIDEYDFLFVYNDDCIFEPGAIETLVKTYEVVRSNMDAEVAVVGSLISAYSLRQTYGGRLKRSKLFPLSSKLSGLCNFPLRVDTLNMNAALIPVKILKNIGFLADYFVHGGADWEYGLRLNKAGYSIFQSPDFVGYCEGNSDVGTSLAKNIACSERFKRSISIKEMPIIVRYKFSKEHGGLLWPLSFLAPFFKLAIYCVLNFFCRKN